MVSANGLPYLSRIDEPEHGLQKMQLLFHHTCGKHIGEQAPTPRSGVSCEVPSSLSPQRYGRKKVEY
jgi:hypothetical protein